LCGLGLAISDRKLFRGRRNRRKNWFVPAEFRLFRGTENSRNSVPNHSAEEKPSRKFSFEARLGQKHAVNYVCWSRIFRKTNFFHIFPRKNLGLLYRGTKTLGLVFQTIPRRRNHLGIPFRSMSGTKTLCQLCFFMSFRSVSSFGIYSSECLGMTTFFRGITESIPILFRGIFSERNSVVNPSVAVAGWGWGIELCCRPYSAGFKHSVSDQNQNLQNCYTTPNKNVHGESAKVEIL
jgi:hypothetical protein